MTEIQADISIEFTSYWLGGTGAGRGREVDAIAHRDRWGCPALPMSQVKGQLRETAQRLADARVAGWTAEEIEYLFGAPSAQKAALTFVGEASLEREVHDCFRAEAPEVRAQLFKRIAATKIGAFGVAEDKTLRAIEAAIPVQLVGRVLGPEIDPSEKGRSWIELLDAACAATLAFGKMKSDGFGRAIVTARIVEGARTK